MQGPCGNRLFGRDAFETREEAYRKGVLARALKYGSPNDAAE